MQIFRGMLLSYLRKNGDDIHVLAPIDGDTAFFDSNGIRIIDSPIDRRGINPIKDFKLFKLYLKTANNINPDMIVTYTIKPNVYGGLVSRIKKVPYAANITGLGTAFENKGVISFIAKNLNRIALKNAKVVFFENTFNRDYFVNNRIVRETQTHVLNGAGVDLERHALRAYPNNKVFKFLFIGRIMREKGIEELFEAMKLLKEHDKKCCLELVGWLEEDYEKTISNYEKEGWLNYRGVQDDVRPFIESADCFVLPSWHEGMANTNLEAAACGRPVITSNIPGCQEAVVDGVSGLLCERKNANSLFSVMNKMIDLPIKERIQMGLAGREHMEKQFDKKEVVLETVKKLLG